MEINRTDNTNVNIKEDFDTNKNIRKLKKAVRKINKFKKLFHEIDKETNEDLNKLRINKYCSCRIVILFIAFIIALTNDFLLPIGLNLDDDFSEPTKNDKFSTM